MGMVQLGEDPGFDQKRLDILGASDSFRVWHLDGDRAVEVIVVSEIDPSEPALTEPTDDPIAPNLGGIAVRRAARTLDRAVASRPFPTGSSSHPRSHSKPQPALERLPFQTRSSSHPLFDP